MFVNSEYKHSRESAFASESTPLSEAGPANTRGKMRPLLLCIRGKGRNRVANGRVRVAKGYGLRYGRTLLQRTQYRRVVEANRQRHKLVVSAHRFNHLPLPGTQHLYRKRLEVTEYPSQI